jgi:hypothetical protein
MTQQLTVMKQQVIMIVGPDRCGKSEIAKELSQRTGMPYFKAQSEHESYLGGDNKFLMQLVYADPRAFDLAKQIGFSMIMDRAYPCEKVYSKVLNRETDEKALAIMDDCWASLETKIIICYRSSYKGIVDDLDSNIDETILEKLSDEYFEFSKWTKCDVMLLNVDDEDLDREVNDIMKWMERNNG